MARRYRQTMKGSFFGDYLYDQVVSPGHFLMQLNRVIDWRPFTEKLIGYYRGKGERGEVPYDPAVILKMLLLAYLYNLSERQTEDFCTNYLPAKAFLGLGVMEPCGILVLRQPARRPPSSTCRGRPKLHHRLKPDLADGGGHRCSSAELAGLQGRAVNANIIAGLSIGGKSVHRWIIASRHRRCPSHRYGPIDTGEQQ